MSFRIFYKITILLYSGQALSDACSPGFSTLVISWSGCHLSICICTTLDGSLFWGCVHWNSAFTMLFGKVFCWPAVTRLKNTFLGLFCIWLLLDSFDGPSSCTGRGSQQVYLCPFLLQTTCGVQCSHYLHLVPHIPHIFFNVAWRDLTYSVIACRNCCTHSVILGALLWSFFISTVPLFFRCRGTTAPSI